MNEIARVEFDELDSLANEARRVVGVMKMLKFRKGDYFCDNVEIERGTQMVAHVMGWVRQWVKFIDKKRVESYTYEIFKKQSAPERREMPDWSEEARKSWPLVDGKPQDPWSLQNLLPMENLETGERYIFVSGTVGGGKAVGDLVETYVTKRKRNRTLGLPLIRLQKTMMPAGPWGPQVRPLFEIVSYETNETTPMHEVSQETLKQVENDDMNDEIPF